MAARGLLEMIPRGYGKSEGRPESLICLSRAGIDLLKEKCLLDTSISYEQVSVQATTHDLEHHLSLNWFRIHLLQIDKILPNLATRFLSSNSPYCLDENHQRPLIYEPPLTLPGGGEVSGFTPDGVFTVTCDKEKASLLFFLEVDMGSQTIANTKSEPGDIREKIQRYQSVFRLRRYKRYESVFQAKLEGFRLLFLTRGLDRMNALCREILSQQPSDFIWVTDQDRMFKQGLADAIWARGGRQDIPLQSILNLRLCCPSPLPDLHP